jgi:hypothetical protein
LLLASLVWPVVFAQTTTFGAIEGTVRDESGGVLPGVTLTLTSPALQVAQLVMVSDAEGRYRFPELRIGRYRLVSELTGFQTFIRENLQIDTGFVARVDIVMTVGGLNETVTVSGASPVVDLTSTRGGQTLTTEVITRALPAFGHSADLVRLTPGLEGSREITATSMGGGATGGNLQITAYGQGESTVMIEDFQVHNNNQPGLFGGTEQMDVKTFGNTSEVQNPGAALNYVFSSGGNQFHGRASGFVMDEALTGDNLDADLRAQGFSQAEKVLQYYDLNASMSGRIVRDKLWFFAAGRDRKSERTIGGFALDPGPDGQYLTGDEPAARPKATQQGLVLKTSYQATPKYQAIGFFWYDSTTDEGRTSGIFPGATARTVPWPYSTDYAIPDFYWNGQFRGTPTNNLTFDVKGGLSWYETRYSFKPGIEVTPHRYDRATQLVFGSSISDSSNTSAQRKGNNKWWQAVGALTYIPQGSVFSGNHQFKVGFRTLLTENSARAPNHPAGNYGLVFDTVGGVPRQGVEITTLSLPVHFDNRLTINSAYVSDQWQIGSRVSLNLGARFEHQHPFVPPQEQEASTFVKAASYPKVDIGKFFTWAPRAAAAWDVTGGGRTALKLSYGWFNSELEYIGSSSFVDLYNPMFPTRTTYRWRDVNRNMDYDPGEVNLDLNGPDYLSITSPANTRPLSADFKVPHSHEVAASLEHEIVPGMAGRLLYVYKRAVGAYETVNVGRPYSAFNIPLQRRDPGPDGAIGTPDDGSMVTIYDYDPAYRGAAFVVNERVNRPDDRADVAQTIEGSVNRRLANNWTISGSIGATKRHRWLEGIILNPNQEYFPLDETWTRTFRVAGSYEMQFGILLGATLRVQDGIPGQRTYVFRAADPLGGPPLRQLSTVTLRLEPYGASRGPVQTKLDFRGAKTFRFERAELNLNVDFMNALNSNAAEAITRVSGPTYGHVTTIPTPRALRLGAQVSF